MERHSPDAATAAIAARRQAASVIGIAGAVGALGGYLIPIGFSASLARTGSVTAAFAAFLTFYAMCLTGTWWCYLRRSIFIRSVPTSPTTRSDLRPFPSPTTLSRSLYP